MQNPTWVRRLWDIPRWRLIGFLASAFVLVSLVVSVAWLSEDAYISFRTASNLLGGHGLRWNVAERVQAYTHPLWLFCVIPIYMLTGHVGLSALGLSFALCVVNTYLLARCIARRPLGLVLTVCMLASSRAFIEFSTSGLENPLTFTLLILFMVLYTRRVPHEDEEHREAPIWQLSVIAGLAMFNRMDTILFLAPAMLEVLSRRGWTKRNVLEASSGAVIIAAWMVFSLVYYGVPFPNTAYAKLGAGLGSLELFSQGLAYLRESMSVDPLTLPATIGVILWAGMSGSRQQRALALGAAFYLLYIIKIGGDFMSGRFLAAPFLVAACLLADKLEVDVSKKSMILAPVAILIGLMGTHPPLWPAPDYVLDQQKVIGDDGIADERKYYFAGTGLMRANALESYPDHGWAHEGRALRKQGEANIVVHGNIGFRGYFAGPKTHYVDPLGLTDPLLARLPAMHRSNWRIGHFERHIPHGYIKTLETDENKISNREISAYYKHIARITRGQLWSSARWRSIWLLNTGQLDHLIPEATSKFAGAKLITSTRVAAPIPDGTRWDKSTVMFHENGLCVSMTERSSARQLTIAADGNDTLRLYLIAGEHIVASFRRRGVTKAGVQTSHHELDGIDEELIDKVCVFPEVGDGAYSLGQLVLK
jgi:arabinofuranosyltransferase